MVVPHLLKIYFGLGGPLGLQRMGICEKKPTKEMKTLIQNFI